MKMRYNYRTEKRIYGVLEHPIDSNHRKGNFLMASANDTSHCVYRIVCFATGKCYIGQTNNLNSRKSKHFAELRRGIHHNTRLQNAYNKYGKRSFYLEVLEEGVESEIVNKREVWWIAHFDAYHNGFNLTVGGDSAEGSKRVCMWNGIEYPSVKSAATANGVSAGTMQCRMARGHTCDADLKKLKSVVWNGIFYPTIKEAAEKNGLTQSAIRCRLIRGHQSDDDMVEIEKPIIWNGVQYPSITVAAKAIGVNKITLRGRIARGHKGDDDMFCPNPVIWNGIEYPSMKAAATALGVSDGTIHWRINKGYTSDADINPNKRKGGRRKP